MKTLTNIYLKNFTSWQDVLFPIHSGITTFLGESNNGKSNILRGLIWLFQNSPSGERMRSHWSRRKEEKARSKPQPTVVRLTNIDNFWIERRKSKAENCYFIKGVKDSLEGFGQKVPEEIQRLVNISGINIHNQLDAPFLLISGSGEVTRYLNELANLKVIDISYKNLNSRKLNINSSTKYYESELEKERKKLKQYENLDSADSDLKELEQLEIEINNEVELTEELEQLINSIEKEQKIIDGFSYVKDALIYLREIENISDDIEMLNGEIVSLKTIIDSIEKEQNKLDRYPKDAQIRIIELEEIERQSIIIENLKDEYAILKLNIDQIEYEEERLNTYKKQLQKQKNLITELIPNICPIYDKECPLTKAGEKI